MRVFLTGATGFIGKAIMRELMAAGHQVLGLARNEEKAAALARAGVEAHIGDLDDLASLAAGASAADGVIHTAFGHDFSKYKQAGETDRAAVEAMGRALEGSDKPLVITSGTSIVTTGRLITEDETAREDAPSGVRAPSEHVLAAASERGVRGIAVRLPPSVHDEGDSGFVPALIAVAREKEFSAYVGDGANRWPAVHRLDAASLFRLALEQSPAGALHGAAEQGIPMREIAEAIGQGLGVPTRSISAEAAKTHFDWMAMFVGVDNPTSNVITRDVTGWDPQRPGLLADLCQSGYFEAASRRSA